MSLGPILILAGGTGGHIFPGLAVAAVLESRGVPVLWLGAIEGLETRLVPAAGIALETVRVSGLRGKGFKALLLAPFRLVRAIAQATAIVWRARPRAVLSLGGFAAGPGGIAAWLLRRPLLVHEQNRIPGYTNRMLAHFARRVLVGFPDAFPSSRRTDYVGNPVRAAIASVAHPTSRLAHREGPLRILVLGGSQGARALNRAMPKALAALPADIRYEVLHQTGAKMHDEAWAAYAEAGVKAHTEPFIDDMAEAYAWADLVVCRSGALTLAELCAVGIGSVLVPFPFAVDDHQTANGQHLAECGAAIVMAEGENLAPRLAHALEALLRNRARLKEMAEAARALSRPDAASKIADICLAEAA